MRVQRSGKGREGIRRLTRAVTGHWKSSRLEKTGRRQHRCVDRWCKSLYEEARFKGRENVPTGPKSLELGNPGERWGDLSIGV